MIDPNRIRQPPRPKREPQLRFTPWAWAKLLYMRDAGPTEVGGFGVTETADRSLVTDVHLINQYCSSVTVAFDDAAVADFFDQQVDEGLRPDQFARIWVHTHPGNSPHPSGTDEETFARVFGNCDWAIMFILARGGAAYARLRFNAGPGGEICLPVDVDYLQPFPGADQLAWQAEYEKCVQAEHGCDFWSIADPDLPGYRRRQAFREVDEEFPIDETFLGSRHDFE